MHPLRHALQLFTDASNEGCAAHLGDYTAKGMWSQPESKLHINFSGPQGDRAFVQGPDCVSGDGQHHCCCLHKQGGRYRDQALFVPSSGDSPGATVGK